MHHPDSNTSLHRRNFLKASTVLGAVALAQLGHPSAVMAASRLGTSRSLLRSGQTILFQGDSITDAGRSREKESVANDPAGLGGGYAWLAASTLLSDFPNGNLKILNRGISGHKVFQLAERWQKDTLDLKPDILSILIGVNDIWHTLTGNYKGTLEIYERDYHALIAQTRKALPDTKLVICEPFVLRCGAVNDKWFPEFDRYREAARRVATKAKATFVPFQAMFDQAVKVAPPDRWAKDGVHPSPDGAALMAHAWVKAVEGN